MKIDDMLRSYAHQTALKLVYNLAKHKADKGIYLDIKTVLERSVEALDNGDDLTAKIVKDGYTYKML